MSPKPSTNDLTRRGFLAVTGALALGSLVGCGGSSGPAAIDQTKAWRFSTRGVDSASNAAKAHAANMRFVSVLAALANRAHPGDKSKVVPIDISVATWQLWFGAGASQIDLRAV